MTSLPRQRTVAEVAEVSGFGFFTNSDVTVRFHPAEPDTGLLFVRSDLPGRPEIRATIAYAVERHRRTALEHNGAAVELTEHLLAALAGLWIDNCIIELDGPEPPGGDGSAKHFVDALLAAGIVEQEQPAAIYGVPAPIVVAHSPADGSLKATPFAAPLALRMKRDRPAATASGPQCVLHYELDYGDASPIAVQSAEYVITPETFAAEIASARTFILESEIAALKERGYGERVTPADLLVFGNEGVIGNTLRR